MLWPCCAVAMLCCEADRLGLVRAVLVYMCVSLVCLQDPGVLDDFAGARPDGRL